MSRVTTISARLCLGLLAGAATFGAGACEVVSSFPAHLSNGVYCLDANLAIDIDVPIFLESNTTLDCQGHRIRNLAAASTGVWARGDNVSLKNCVLDGWGVIFTEATNYVIEGNTVIDADLVAIQSVGSQGYIKGNKILNLVAQHGNFTGIYSTGIADIIENTVMDLKDSDIVDEYDGRVGILASEDEGGVVMRNIVQNVGRGSVNGAAVRAIGRPIVYRNVIVSAPGLTSIGVQCFDWAGLHPQNVVVGADLPYFHCPLVVYE